MKTSEANSIWMTISYGQREVDDSGLCTKIPLASREVVITMTKDHNGIDSTLRNEILYRVYKAIKEINMMIGEKRAHEST